MGSRPGDGSRPGALAPLGVAMLVLATLAAVIFTQGSLVACAPVLLVAAVAVFWVVPLRFSVSFFVFLVFLVDAAPWQQTPTTGEYWIYPFAPLTVLFFEKFDKLLGIGGLYLNGLELFLVAAGARIALEAALRERPRHERPRVQTASCMVQVEVLALIAIAAFELRGLQRGGDLRSSLYQIRQLVYLPLLALVLQGALRDPDDLRLVGRAVVGAATIKAAIAFYAYVTVFRPAHYDYNFITSHSDSVLFSVAAIGLWVNWMERKDAARRRLLLWLSPIILLGAAVNGRRLVFLELAAGALLLFALTPPSPRKQSLKRWMVVLAPVCLLYVAAGWGSSAGVFSPVRSVRGVIDGEVDPSTRSRERENFNLVWTFRMHPVLGSGFGHPYEDVYGADDLSDFFEFWRFIPHNSVLGLCAFTGFVGFSLIWMPMAFGLLLAVRSYRLARRAWDRVTMLTASMAIVAFGFQAFGDMGFQDTGSVMVVGLAIAAAAKTAVAVGAWPRRVTEPSWALASDALTTVP